MINDNINELSYKLSKGNPGAITVVVQLLQHGDGMKVIEKLLIKNITGSELWVAFKQQDKDIERFVQSVIGSSVPKKENE